MICRIEKRQTTWDILLPSPLRSMLRRLDDRIKELSAKAVATSDPPELEKILRQLQVALHEQSERVRKMVSDYPRVERRSTKKD